MSKRNNIEDFFNNSLDGFNEQPSNQVWSGIEEMLAVKVPFWKTWKFWGWFSSIVGLVIFLVSYQVIINQKMTTLVNQNTILLEQNQLLTQEMEETQFALKQTKKEKESLTEILNNVKVASATEEKMMSNASKGQIAKEQPYFTSAFAKEQLDFSISSWIDNRKEASINTFDEAKKIQKKLQKDDLWQMKFDASVQESIVGEQQVESSKKTRPSSSASEGKPIYDFWASTKPLKALNRISQNQYFLPVPNAYQRTNLALVKGSYIRPIAVKLTKPPFIPSLRLGLTGGVFTSISNIPNSIIVANNNGLVLQWQALRNWGLTGALRYNELNYEVSLDASNQDVLQRYPKTERINEMVENIIATHHYLDLPMGVIWKMPIGEKDNKIYVNPSIAWQFYLPQIFKYQTFDNTTITTENNRLYAYFGSAIFNAGYETKLRSSIRLQMGIWAERSFVEYGADNRTGTNIGASATFVFGK